METLPPLALELIADHLLNIYDPSEPMIAVARDAGSCARVSRWFRESLALPLYEFVDPGCTKPDTQRSGLGCPVRFSVRFILDSKVCDDRGNGVMISEVPEMSRCLRCLFTSNPSADDAERLHADDTVLLRGFVLVCLNSLRNPVRCVITDQAGSNRNGMNTLMHSTAQVLLGV